jgi:hypothetical protein
MTDLQLTPLEGPGGLFKIAFAGLRKDETDAGYDYQDDRGCFGFYAEVTTSDKVNVNGAQDGRAWSGGGPFQTSPQNEAIFRRNIEFFFQTRDWWYPEKPSDAAVGLPVTFSWDILRHGRQALRDM